MGEQATIHTSHLSLRSGGQSVLRVATATPARRYLHVSVANTVAGQALIGVGFGILHWSASRAALVATALVCIPAFFAYQRWVWCDEGPTRLSSQVAPFVVISLAGLVASTQAAAAAEAFGATVTSNRAIQTGIVMVATTASLLLLWVIRFLLFQSVFTSKSPRPAPAAASGSS